MTLSDHLTKELASFQTDVPQRDTVLNILAIDDDRVILMYLEALIIALGHQVVSKSDAVSGMDYLQQNPGKIDIILMDREMPIMDGLTAVHKIKERSDWRHIPIIMITAADQKQHIQQGLAAGVFHYLTKPVEEGILKSVLTAAVREATYTRQLMRELKQHKLSFDLIDTIKIHFQTTQQAEALAGFVANCFKDPERVVTGLAELMINAIEHGNLGIGYDKKTELVATGTWQAELQRRLLIPGNDKKHAEIVLSRKDQGTYVIITDEGAGFDWKRYLRVDPSRSSDNHGRGIALASMRSFDKLTFNEKGNQVVAFVHDKEPLKW